MQQHLDTLFLFAIAFLSTVIFIPFIIKFAHSKGFLEANDRRKMHREEVSSFGGLAIYLGTAIAIASVVNAEMYTAVMAFALGFPLLVVGFIDDLFGVGISPRIVLQVLVGVLAYELGFQIVETNDWFFDMGATVFFVMLFINAYNFIDGINGLSGSLGLVGSLFIFFLLAGKGEMGMATFCLAYTGGLVGFLVYNFREKAKIFMGDCGSTVLGFFMAVMVMMILKNDVVTIGAPLWPVLLALVSVPIFDLIKVVLWRILHKRSPVSPDRTHIHHLLVDGLLSHRMTSLILSGWTIGATLFIYVFPQFFSVPSLIAFLGIPHALTGAIQVSKKYSGHQMSKLRKA